jgi:hypothetical protein
MAASVTIRHPVGTSVAPGIIQTATGNFVVQGSSKGVRRVKLEVLDDQKAALANPPKIARLEGTRRCFAFMVRRLPVSGQAGAPPYYWIRVSALEAPAVKDEQAVKIVSPGYGVAVTYPLAGATVPSSFTAWGDVSAAGDSPKYYMDNDWGTFVGTLTFWDGDTCAFSFTNVDLGSYDLTLSQLTDGAPSSDVQSPITVVAG